MVFDFGFIGATLDAADGDLPEFLPATGIRVVPAIDGALTLKTGGEGAVKDGSAAIHVEKNRQQWLLQMVFIGLNTLMVLSL